MIPVNQSFAERRCNGVPEIADDQFVVRPSFIGMAWKSDVIRLDSGTTRRGNGGFENILEFPYIAGITVIAELLYAVGSNCLTVLKKVIHKQRHVVQTMTQRRNLDRKDIQPVIE